MAVHLAPSKADSLENLMAAPTASKMEPQMVLTLDCLKADSKDEPKAARSEHCLVAPMDASKDENLECYWVDLKAGPMAHSLEKSSGHCLVDSKAGLKAASMELPKGELMAASLVSPMEWP